MQGSSVVEKLADCLPLEMRKHYLFISKCIFGHERVSVNGTIDVKHTNVQFTCVEISCAQIISCLHRYEVLGDQLSVKCRIVGQRDNAADDING